jgi:hypothetical protein
VGDQVPELALDRADQDGGGSRPLPISVQRDSYVFLDSWNLNARQGSEELGGDTVSYRYPLEFLDQNKDLIYSSGGARVYR